MVRKKLRWQPALRTSPGQRRCHRQGPDPGPGRRLAEPVRRPRHALPLPPGRCFVLRHRSHALQEHGRTGCAACRYSQSWPRWFHGIHKVVWTSNKPYGVGTTRSVWLTGITVDERFFRWEHDRRFSFYLTGHSVPLAHAFAEDYRLDEVAGGETRFTYSVAIEPRRPDRATILRLDGQERLQRSARLRSESGHLPAGRRKVAMRVWTCRAYSPGLRSAGE